ncbi:MAG: hypothetical protein ACXAC2_12160 [Candidatus Kariarchaeaceae archaeon]|jgi:hypothetical protein
MSTANIFESPLKRTLLFSAVIALFLFWLAFTLPILESTENEWYGFMYEDLETPEEDRYNLSLVLLESFVLSLFYLFTLIFVASLADLRTGLAGWNEVFVSGIVTLILAFFFPRFSVGGGVGGTESSTGFNHFTSDMQLSVFFLTLIGIVLLTLYVMKSAEENQESNN